MRLTGKVAVITGAASGIGQETARLFAAEGASVAALDLQAEAAEKVASDLADAAAFACDVSDPEQVDAAFASLLERFGRVDCLVNVAGVDRVPGDGHADWEAAKLAQMGDMATGGPVVHHVDQLLNMTNDAWRRMLAINLDGVFYCTRAALRTMVDQEVKGTIVNCSSLSALSGFGQSHYAASKGGVLGLTRGLALELGSRGIRVNAICPGAIDTPMTKGAPPAMLAGAAVATPLGRLGTPEEIAKTALFLASDDSSYMTGQWISPNGGLFIG